ncbi:MAG: DUF488 domain-containing protein [Fimbriimonadales bacterium]|nr:DUF488 domain-containing protein [Fimbriimonadales bacterium]
MQLFSIGHSNHTPERFLELLRLHQIEAVVDVRSRPYSRRFPHFGREAIEEWLPAGGVAYHFMGDGLGGFPNERDCYADTGQVLYERVARKPFFQQAIEQLLKLPYARIALMCSEENPSECHRAKLIAQHLLRVRGVEVQHIRGDGSLVSESARLAGQTPSLFEEYALGASRKTLSEP